MQTDSPKPPPLPEMGNTAEPVVLSYAAPAQVVGKRISGVENARAVILAYLCGGWLATFGMFIGTDPSAPFFNGGVGAAFGMGFLSLLIAAIGVTLFALTLTRRIFPPLRPRQRRSIWLAGVAAIAHIAAIVGFVRVTLGLAPELETCRIVAAAFIYFGFPAFAGSLIRGSRRS